MEQHTKESLRELSESLRARLGIAQNEPCSESESSSILPTWNCVGDAPMESSSFSQ